MNTSTTKTKNHASGIGGSHARWLMFGARGPLLAPEGDGGGGTGSSGGNDGGTTTTATTPAPGSGTKVTFTPEQQEEVNRIASRSREEGRKAATKPSSTTTTTTSTPSGEGGSGGEEKLSLKALQARLDESEQRRVFEKHANKAGIPEDASEDLFELYKAQKPTDSAQWFASKKALFGFTAAAGTQQQTTTTTTTQTGGTAGDGKAAAAAPGAPAKVDPITTGGMVDIWNLSLEQVKSLGPQGIRAEHEKILQVGRSQSGAPPVPSVLRRK